jgi:hypothetical protein
MSLSPHNSNRNKEKLELTNVSSPLQTPRSLCVGFQTEDMEVARNTQAHWPLLCNSMSGGIQTTELPHSVLQVPQVWSPLMLESDHLWHYLNGSTLQGLHKSAIEVRWHWRYL